MFCIRKVFWGILRRVYKDANTSPDFWYKESVLEDFCGGGMDASKRIVLGLRSLGIHPISEYPDRPQGNYTQ